MSDLSTADETVRLPLGILGRKAPEHIVRATSIPLKSVRHNDLECYVHAGYGGEPISEWPFKSFIVMYLSGYNSECVEQWTKWLQEQFRLYGESQKDRGGMYGGSVHRESSRFIEAPEERLIEPKLLPEVAISKGAEALVQRRLMMVASVAANGYVASLDDPIYGVRYGRSVVLKGGHHRAATLYALGYTELPDVYVFSLMRWKVRGLWKRITKFIASRRRVSTSHGCKPKTGTKRLN